MYIHSLFLQAEVLAITVTIELRSTDRVEIRGRMRHRELILDVGVHLLMEVP